MADDNTTSGDASSEVTFKVKTSGDSNHTITISEYASVLDLKTKLAGADYENIPVERQRLIYSGRVMKNEEPLITYKIKSGNTVHMVKSAASNPSPAPAASASQPAPQQVPSNMSAGTANNPLAGLTGARYAGLTGLPSRDMFGPDGGMVGNMYDEEQMAQMLSNPMVVSQMNEMLNNDQFIDMMVQQSPMLRNNPNAREVIRSPMFRQMMTNPEALRSAARMQRMMGGGQGASAFPAPGATDTTPAGAASSGASEGGNAQSAQANPFGAAMPGFNPELLQSMFGGAGGGAAGANPFAMFGQPPTQPNTDAQAGAQAASNPPQTGSTTASPAPQSQGGAAQNPTSPPPNPFAGLFGGNLGAGAGAGGAGANPLGLPPMSPEALQQMMQLMGMGSPGGGGSPAPPDNRPPEERYADQLRQLNDMGFYDFDRNVAALRRSGGSVQGAIEHLLGA